MNGRFVDFDAGRIAGVLAEFVSGNWKPSAAEHTRVPDAETYARRLAGEIARGCPSGIHRRGCRSFPIPGETRMSSVAEMLPVANRTVPDGTAPGVVFVTPHKATFFKPLYEAFANAQPRAWRTSIVWPEGHRSEHPQELLTPCASNLEIRRVAAAWFWRQVSAGTGAGQRNRRG